MEEFSMLVTIPQLRTCMPKATEFNLGAYIVPINDACEKFKIDTPKRLAAFISNIAHETNCLSSVVENLNYSEQRLLEIFPKYFTPEQAKQYAHKPEAIANRVYANRMGNGPESSGDGWKHRGAGLFQSTGKENQRKAGEALGEDFVSTPAKLRIPKWASLSAALFWNDRNLNYFADLDMFKTIVRKINGGLNGYADRYAYWILARKAFGITEPIKEQVV